VFTILLGFMQFGWQQADWNVIQQQYIDHFKWNTSQAKLLEGLVTTVYSAGAMIGAIAGGSFVKYGKWNMIMISNISALIGYGFCVYAQIWAVFAGRFFLGLAIGGYCVFCPKFVNEITPVEYRGPVGAMSQVSVAVGILIVPIYGFFYDYK